VTAGDGLLHSTSREGDRSKVDTRKLGIAEKLMIRRQNPVLDLFLYSEDFVQMAVGLVLLDVSLDALIQRTFIDQIGTRVVRGADPLLIDGRPFTKLCGSVEIDSGIGHLRLQSCYFSEAARSRFERAVLVFRVLRRPMIAPVLRPRAAPIVAFDLPAAFN
jgi:hypothetical protein